MKKPDEIKKGLECCTNPDGCRWDDGCPYGANKECSRDLKTDALALIQQLEIALSGAGNGEVYRRLNMSSEQVVCPWCGGEMRFDADSVHVWYKCDNCLAASPKARRVWDSTKSTQENWLKNNTEALLLIQKSNIKEPRWISVEERLPEGVCLAVNGCGAMMVGYVEHDKYSVETRYSCEDHDTGCGMLDVTHWMPLPSIKGVHWQHVAMPEAPKEETK